MRLDPVHDLQKVFRKLLAAQASPGTIAELSREAELLDLELPINKGVLLLALALLDAETSFCVSSSDSAALGDVISHLTYARRAGPGESDFVFVLGGKDVARSIRLAREGTLVDPHLGSTLVIEVARLSGEGELILAGPGIETKARLGMGAGRGADLDPGWLEARSAKNAEFPLGVDLLFVDEDFRLAALPRTTLVRRDA
jgi:alpha-D-ribose 1-methylphosphonate 5-triphosphate synthase subunit PhnH